MSVSDKIWGAESRWLMGRVMPPKFLDGVGEYLHLVAPDREGELTAAIKARAEETADADREMVVDGPSEGEPAPGGAM